MLIKKSGIKKTSNIADINGIQWNIEGCKTLLEAGARVNGEDHFKRTALYYAILNNYYDVVKLLLSNKANPYAKDIYDKPLTQYVVESKNDSIIKIFEKYKNSFTTPFRFEKFVELLE